MELPFARVREVCRSGEKLPFSESYAESFGEPPLPVDAKLEGFFSYDRSHYDLIKLHGFLSGNITLICDLSGDDFVKPLSEEIEFYLSDGIVNQGAQEPQIGGFLDIVECQNGVIDLKEILRSELEMIRCDYHIKE